MTETQFRNRRTCPTGDALSPIELIRANMTSAERQLTGARETLISARHRVASIEAAYRNWAEMADELEHAGRALTY